MLRSICFALAAAAAALTLSTAANAHSPHDVMHILQDRGYTNIDFVDTNPPIYMANACREGIRYHFHVDNYGQVTERSRIGYCDENDHNRRRRWGEWRR